MQTSPQQGFVALMSVIIMSAMLAVVVFTLGASTFFSRFNILDTENKHVARELAEGCVHAAMLEIAKNQAYLPAVGGDCISLGGDCLIHTDPQKVCKICSVAYSGGRATITTRALYNRAYTNLSVAVETTPGSMAVTYWNEAARSEASGCTLP